MAKTATKSAFIAAWITQQQRAFGQATRGIMTPEERRALEAEAEKMFAEHERQVIAESEQQKLTSVNQHAENSVGHIAFAQEVGLETERGKAWLTMAQIEAQLATAAEQKRIADWLEAWPLGMRGEPMTGGWDK